MVTFRNILEDPVFRNAEILCGERGLGNIVGRISVFDCPYEEVLTNKDILRKGDLFITCLEQFPPYVDENVYDFFQLIIDQKSAGLFLVGEKGKHNMTEDAYELCEQSNFPVVYLDVDMPYALIMDTVNQYISFDNTNALNIMKIERILYGREDMEEYRDILMSIKPTIEPYLAVGYVNGVFSSDLSKAELYMQFQKYSKDIVAFSSDATIFIWSDETPEKLQLRRKICLQKLNEFIQHPKAGLSRIYQRNNILKALEESRKSMIVAKTLSVSEEFYDPLNTLQLLLAIRDSRWASDFYDSYMDRLTQNVSKDNLKEMLRTIELYVAHKGAYREVAKEMNQHENTIRYRINRVRGILDMEDDPIRFHETIAVAVKLGILLGDNV